METSYPGPAQNPSSCDGHRVQHILYELFQECWHPIVSQHTCHAWFLEEGPPSKLTILQTKHQLESKLKHHQVSQSSKLWDHKDLHCLHQGFLLLLWTLLCPSLDMNILWHKTNLCLLILPLPLLKCRKQRGMLIIPIILRLGNTFVFTVSLSNQARRISMPLTLCLGHISQI